MVCSIAASCLAILIEHHYGTLLNGALESIADHLDALDRDHARAVVSA
jgi:hypothetical protein